MKRSYVWPDRSDGAERTGRGTDVNTARLCFGNGEQTAFHQLNESPKCSCELQANMAEYCVCGSPVGGRFVSMEMSWGVPVYAAWSPRTPRGRPLPEDWESSRLRFEKKDKVQQREGRGRKERSWVELSGRRLHRKTPPLNHRCWLPVSPAASSWSPAARSLHSSGDADETETWTNTHQDTNAHLISGNSRAPPRETSPFRQPAWLTAV